MNNQHKNQKQSQQKDKAAISAPLLIAIAGFAATAVVAMVWIGNTTAGASADTANCIVTVDTDCMTSSGDGGGSSSGVGKGNAGIADDNRVGGPSWSHDFASKPDNPDGDSAKIAAAVDKGIERFGGEKSAINTRIKPLFDYWQGQLMTGPQALAKTQELLTELRKIRADGEQNMTNDLELTAAIALLEDTDAAKGPLVRANEKIKEANGSLDQLISAFEQTESVLQFFIDNNSDDPNRTIQTVTLTPEYYEYLLNAQDLYQSATKDLHEAKKYL